MLESADGLNHVEFLLLLSGPIAVGKTFVRDHLIAHHEFSPVRSSSYLRALLVSRGQEESRFALQELGDALDLETDYRWLIDQVAAPQISANPSGRKWLIDSVRKARQVEHFRSRFGSKVLHVHLTASDEALVDRYARRQAIQVADAAAFYAAEIAHTNEASSRGLASFADAVIETDAIDPSSIAAEILAEFRSHNG